MTTLLDRRKEPIRGRRPDGTAGMPVTAGALVAVQAVAASISMIMVPVVLAWATASFSSAPWSRALQFGAGTWLLAHHAGIVIPGGHIGLVPLGLMAIPLVCCWLAGVRLARGLDPNAADLRAGVGRARPVMPPARALICMVACYSGMVTVVSVLATSVAVRPLAAQALVGAVVISSVGGVCGAAAWAGGGLIPGIRLVLGRLRMPSWFTRIRAPLAVTIAVQLAGGLVILIGALMLGWDRVLLLHHAVSPGLAGGLVLVVAQLTVLPNLVVWTVAVTAGPGFMAGAGTSVQAGQTTLGLLPAVPALGALPPPGPHPAWAWGVLALPALSGVVLGVLVVRRDLDAGLGETFTDVGRAVAVLGVFWALAGWLSGGPAGPGTLSQFGPAVGKLSLAMMGEAGSAAVLVVAVMLAVRHFSARPPAEPADRIIDLTDATSPEQAGPD